MPLGKLSVGFQSVLPLPTSKLGPSGAASWVDDFMYVLGHCGSLQRTLPWGWEFLPLPQLPQVFSVWGFEALFPHTGTLGCEVCLAPQLFLPVYLHANVGLPALPVTASPGPPASALPWVLSTQWPISAPPSSLDECLFFNSWVVGLPYISIFCEFWYIYILLLFLNLLLSFFWLCEDAQYVYLCLHFGCKSL